MDKKTTAGLVQDNGKGKTGGARKSHKRAVKKGRKGSQELPSKKYPLRSADSSSGRVLRSNSKEKNNAPSGHVNDNSTVQSAAKKRKRGRPAKGGSPKNEYFRIRQRVRYILNRMNYEQSLIQAYASEGWKGQSLEKIRPEKELERAKAEILRCKLRIREAFRNMDSLQSEGKLDESLFDSEGEISSEDIFCAICGSKHVTLKNDIILCDGTCDRGFHQNCLNPPLLAEDIPAGDEGWLCPACDCKIDCIDVLNELQGSRLSIHDSWEKVFPEAASHANGSKQIDASDLPSDDSEDNDFNPDLAEGHMLGEDKSSAEDGGEGSDSDDSDFITSSENSEPSKNKKSESSNNKKTVDDLGLPSEDSEDDDFDPAGPGSSEDQKDESKSDDESDFTSDTDDFCTEIAKSHGQDEVSAPSLSDVKIVDHLTDGMEISVGGKQPNAEDPNCAFSYIELEQDMVLPVSSRRQVERLDYKKLYDDAYGKELSDSTDDEEWSGNSTPQTGNLEDSETDSLADLIQPTKNWSRRAPAELQTNEHTPQRHSLSGSASEEQTEVIYSNGSSSTARKRHFGPIVNLKLKEFFKKDPYPSRAIKESLAQELGLTFHQVTKWFASTRHYSRVAAAKNDKDLENHSAENNDRGAIDRQLREPNDRLMEELSVDRNDMVSQERAAQNNIVEGNNEDIPFRQDISCQQRVVVTPFVNQNCPTNSIEVGSPKGGPGTSRNVGIPGGKSAENKIPGLEFVDEARKKAILRELRKRKTGR